MRTAAPRVRRNDLSRRDMDGLYQKYLPLCRRLARKFYIKHRGTIPLDDLVTEALSAWGGVVAEWPYRYQPGKSAVTTWAYHGIYWRLHDYCSRNVFRETVADLSERTDLAAGAGWLETLVRNLGEDARILVTTILHAPAEIVEEIMPACRADPDEAEDRTWYAVSDYLEDRLEWPPIRVTSAWREVAEALN